MAEWLPGTGSRRFMAKNSKQIQQSKDIVLNSSMNERTNPVYLEASKGQSPITSFSYLQNSDSFYSNALASRQGTTDFCGGPVQYTPPTGLIFANLTGAAGIVFSTYNNGDPLHTQDAANLIIADRDIYIQSGTYTVHREMNIFTTTEAQKAERFLPLGGRVSVFQTDGSSLPASGAGYFVSNNTFQTGRVYSIKKGDSYDNVAPFSATYPLSGTNPAYYPLAQTDQTFQFTTFTDNGNRLTSDTVEIPYVFESPVYLKSGNVYAIKYEHFNLTGTQENVILAYHASRSTTTDFYPNIVAGILEVSSSTGQNSKFRGNNGPITKDWIKDTIYEYVKPGFIINDIPAANISLATPFSGSYFYSGASYSTFNPLTDDLSVNTRSEQFGNIVSVASGTNVQGCFIYATPWGARYSLNNNNPGNIPSGVTSALYTLDKEVINPLNYDVNLKCELATIDITNGTVGTSGYRIFQTTPIASGTTQYTFRGKDNLAYSPIGNPNTGELDKIYFLFNEPVLTSWTGNHLLSWRFENIDNEPLDDFGYVSYSGNGFVTSPIQVGYTQSGSNFVSRMPTGTYLYHPTINDASIGFTGSAGSINSGLISLASSGTAINGVYDFTNSALVQKILYHQADKIKAFSLTGTSPQFHTVISSGLVISPNALATYETYDDMALMTNYGFNNPQKWDSAYPLTYDLSHPAVFSGVTASGVGNLPSGVYNFLFATEMSSGGYKASTLTGISVNGSGVGSGAIIHIFVGSGSINNQYPFDIPTDHGATRVFMNLPSGVAPDGNSSIYYLANLSVSGTLAGSYYPNPLPNNISDFYITNFSGITNFQVPDVIPESQVYLQNQIEQPIKFKKLLRWYDYIVGFGGDDQSLLYYSQIGCPNIYGGIGSKYGFLTVGNNSGSPITSIARYKQWLLVFTKNTMWKITFQGSSSTPFLIEPISTKNGDIGVFSTVETDEAIFGINQYGIFAANANGIECISKAIDPFFKSLNKDQLTFSTGLLNQDRREIYWSITNDVSNPDSTIGLTFNYEFNTISVRVGGLFNSANVIRDSFGFDILLGGDYNGFINQISADTNSDVLFSDGLFETTEPINFIYETEWMYLTGDTYNKFLDRFHQNIEPNTGNLIIQVFFDGRTTPAYTRKMRVVGGNPDKISILGGQAVSVKFRVINQGNIAPLKINSMTLDFHPESSYRPM